MSFASHLLRQEAIATWAFPGFKIRGVEASRGKQAASPSNISQGSTGSPKACISNVLGLPFDVGFNHIPFFRRDRERTFSGKQAETDGPVFTKHNPHRAD